MARIDYPNTEEGIEEFLKYAGRFIGTGRMGLFVTKKGEAILRPLVASRIDSAYMGGLSEQQIKGIEGKYDKDSTFHVNAFHWRDEVPERLEA